MSCKSAILIVGSSQKPNWKKDFLKDFFKYKKHCKIETEYDFLGTCTWEKHKTIHWTDNNMEGRFLFVVFCFVLWFWGFFIVLF